MNILISVIRVIGTQLNLNLSIEFGCGVADKWRVPTCRN